MVAFNRPPSMTTPNVSSTPLWESLNVDVLIKVANATILSPMFTMWIPILIKANRASLTDPAFVYSCYYVLFTLVYVLVPYSSRIWTNHSWDRGFLRGFLGGHQLDWSDQIVLVTGGSSGLGKAIVETLAVRHVTVISLDKKPAKFESTFDDVYSYECDVSNRNQVLTIAATIQKEVGHPTIIINNAGIVQPASILSTEQTSLESTLKVNTMAHYWTLQAFLPQLIKKNKGHVITIASALGFVSAMHLSSYCASKGAVLSFHDTLQLELKHLYKADNVRTTLVCPGLLGTDLFSFVDYHTSIQNFLAPPIAPHDLVKEIIKAIDAEESRVIYMPFYTKLVWMLRGLPDWLVDGTKWLGNLNHSVHLSPSATKEN